jgi:hypothetical protein
MIRNGALPLASVLFDTSRLHDQLGKQADCRNVQHADAFKGTANKKTLKDNLERFKYW